MNLRTRPTSSMCVCVCQHAWFIAFLYYPSLWIHLKTGNKQLADRESNRKEEPGKCPTHRRHTHTENTHTHWEHTHTCASVCTHAQSATIHFNLYRRQKKKMKEAKKKTTKREMKEAKIKTEEKERWKKLRRRQQKERRWKKQRLRQKKRRDKRS